MILNPGECILCKNRAEARALGNLLYEHGYRMFANQFDIRKTDSSNWHGLRWYHGHEFPNCIVATSSDQKDHVLENHKLQGVKYTYEWYADFFDRLNRQNVDVGDLL